MENKTKSEKLIEEFVEKLENEYEKETKEFVKNTPEEFKESFDCNIERDDIGVADVRIFVEGTGIGFGGEQSISEVRYAISDYIADEVIPSDAYLKEVEEITAITMFEDEINKSEYSIEQCKRIIASKLIQNNVDLWQQEFKDQLISELQGPATTKIDEKEVNNKIFDVLEEIENELGEDNWVGTDELLVKWCDKQMGEAEKEVKEEVERLTNLSPEEKEKLNAYMKENLDKEDSNKNKIIDSYNGSNIDERIGHLEMGVRIIEDIRKEYSKGVYKKAFTDMSAYYSDYDYDLIKDIIEKEKVNYSIQKTYPNGIKDGNKYSDEVIEDCRKIVISTKAYKDMVGSTQEQLLNGIANINNKESLENKASDIVERMAVGEDVLGEGQVEENTNNKQMGYTAPWLLGLVTGALATTITILVIKMLG